MVMLKGALIKGVMEGRVSNMIIQSEVKDGLLKMIRLGCFKSSANVKSLSQTIGIIGCVPSQRS